MTTREKLEQVLESRGMFPQQAKAVMDLAIPELDKMGGPIAWNGRAEDYPPALYAVAMVTINDIALKWIDENLPLAWFRPMFDPEQLKKIEEEMAKKDGK